MHRNPIGAGVLWLIGTMVALVGCATAGSGFVVALPNGYEMIRGKADAPTIVTKRGGVVVPGPIAAYTVLREVVTGQVQAPASSPTSHSANTPVAPKQGYFVLDTRTGEAGVGLSEADWNERLKDLGLPASPELAPPLLPK